MSHLSNIPRKSADGRTRMRHKIQTGRILRTAKMNHKPKGKGARNA